MCHVYLERKTFSGGIWDCLAVEGMVSWRQIFREVADMEEQFLNLTEENLDQEHLCCIIRSKKPHPGVEAKRAWLRERLREGHVFRKLDAKAWYSSSTLLWRRPGCRWRAKTISISTACGLPGNSKARATAGS